MTEPTQYNLTVTLEDISLDVTDYVHPDMETPKITSALNEEFDTLSITLYEFDEVEPVEWEEITVKNGSTVLFGGYIIDVKQRTSENVCKNDWVLGCSDYGSIFNKIYVKEQYEDKTDEEIIDAIFADAAELASYNTALYVTSLQTFPRVRFNRKTVRDVLDWLCEQTGGHWYVDYSKNLHFFGTEEDSSPYDVTDNVSLDSSTKRLVENLTKNLDGSAVVNLVEVVGGDKLSDDITEYYTPEAFRTDVFLNHRYQPASTLTKIQAKRNDGGAVTNIIENPSFEVNITDAITNFQDGTGAAWVREANAGAFGSYVLKITAGTALSGIYYSKTVTVTPGDSYTASVTGWCSIIGKAGIRIWNTVSAVAFSTSYNQKASTWERITCTYTNTSSANKTIRVELINIAVDSTLVTYFDGAQLEKTSYPTAYCDGTLGTGYAWTGTAHNSESTRVDMDIWTTLTVKTGGIDTMTSRNDVLYYESTARLEQQAYLPTRPGSIEIFGRYEIPMRSRVRNQESHDHYGKWFESVIVAPEILDKEVGQMRGKAELARNAFSNTAITYTTREPGLKSGQTQHIDNTSKGINGN